MWARLRLPLSGRPSLEVLLERRSLEVVRLRRHMPHHMEVLLRRNGRNTLAGTYIRGRERTTTSLLAAAFIRIPKRISKLRHVLSRLLFFSVHAGEWLFADDRDDCQDASCAGKDRCAVKDANDASTQ